MSQWRPHIGALVVAVLLPLAAYAQTSGSAPGFSGTGYTTGGGVDGYACTMQYDPVCGAREVQCITAPCYPQYETFGNECMLRGEGATFIHKGECTPEESGPVTNLPTPAPFDPPASCTSWNDGCNVCTRSEGGTACTLRYCEKPGAGYCIAYGNEGGDTPVVSPTPIPVPEDISAPAPTPAPVFVGEETRGSFFKAISNAWNTLLVWLGF